MERITTPQVATTHYEFSRYADKERWVNYWYQLKAVLSFKPQSVLEIGPGDGTVTMVLRKYVDKVTTCDIDPELKPDVVGSVAKLPFRDGEFDVVLCSEVLEHIPFLESEQGMKEIYRVAKKGAVIGVPHAGGVFLGVIKLPLLPYLRFFTKLPFFWKKHSFNGQHYWETGKKGSSRKKVMDAIKSAGFAIMSNRIAYDDPAHFILICKK